MLLSVLFCGTLPGCHREHRKNPLCPIMAGGGGKEPLWNMAELVLFSKVCSQGNLFNQNLHNQEEGKYSTPVPSSNLFYLRGMCPAPQAEKSVWISQSRNFTEQAHEQTETQSQNASPPPHLTTIFLEDYA